MKVAYKIAVKNLLNSFHKYFTGISNKKDFSWEIDRYPLLFKIAYT